MRTMEENSVDAIVTDPPYGLTTIDEAKTRAALDQWMHGDDSFVPDGKGFMNKRWDQFVPPPAVWREAMRVVKPGGYLLCFAGSRTIDLMTLSIRMGGFDIKDTIEWFYGSGMPKSMNIAKSIDKKRGHVGDVIGTEQIDTGMQGGQLHTGRPKSIETREVRALSSEAQQWEGWFTSLKPAHEPIVVARKPGGEDSNAISFPPFRYHPKATTIERPTYVSDTGEIVAHSTVKPVEVMRWCLSLCVPPAGKVLDPFLGSGTTCEAATINGMESIGIELDKVHIPLITERLTGHDIWAGGLLD
jgi:DNA modification methylase